MFSHLLKRKLKFIYLNEYNIYSISQHTCIDNNENIDFKIKKYG